MLAGEWSGYPAGTHSSDWLPGSVPQALTPRRDLPPGVLVRALDGQYTAATHVETGAETSRDAGSIPAASSERILAKRSLTEHGPVAAATGPLR